MSTPQELNASLRSSQARWSADKTPLTNLTQAEKARRLGVVVDRVALAAAMAPRRAQVETPQFDREVDWRNRNGNRVTPVKDQGGCGSCVSFGVAGTVESMALIELDQMLDLSEADLHFCSDHGATCDGWWPDGAYASFKARGVTSEANFPYNRAFNSSTPFCNLAGDRDFHVVRVTESSVLQSATERKNWLTKVGPCTAVLRVFDDFFSYRDGIYHHVSGQEAGLHCVMVVGYSEAEQCWICKNSWGSGWGMQGFFKIAYGQCGIDTEFPFWATRGVKLPTPFGDGPAVVARRSTNRDVFVRGLDNQLWHKWWSNPGGWSGWYPLGGCITSAPSVISAGSDHVDVYARGMDKQLWQKWWGGSGWSEWVPLGGQLTSAPGVVARKPTQRDVFGRGLDGQLWHKWWNNSSGWSDWFPLGGNISSAPSVVSAGPEHIDVYVRGSDKQLWQRWWNGAQWSDWTALGGQLTSAPAVVARTPNHRDVFARGLDRRLWHRFWVSGSGWSNWIILDNAPVGSAPAVTSAAPDHMDLYVRGEDGQLYQKHWTASRGWSVWIPQGGQLAAVVEQ